MKIKNLAGGIVLALLLLLAKDALAMSSPNYRVDWLIPVTGGGGGPANSANFKVNFTIGQTASGTSANLNHRIELGFWSGADVAQGVRLFLPLITH